MVFYVQIKYWLNSIFTPLHAELIYIFLECSKIEGYFV